jgi:two-component system NarL family sensor kinase
MPSGGAATPPEGDASRVHLGPAEVILNWFPSGRYESSPARPDLAGLAAVQGSIMRNYFRLLRAQEELEERARVARARPRTVVEHAEAERARLAHELHATAGQALAGIKIHLELIDSFLPDQSEQVRASLHRIGLLAQEALGQLRSVAHRIHPPDWERFSLAEALRSLWDTTGIPYKFEAELEIVPLATEPPQDTRVLLYRVAQEALANVVRHARATQVRLGLGPGAAGRVQLAVEDNGTGFDVSAAVDDKPSQPRGIGLRSMREQLRWAGGGLLIESGPGGTRLLAWVPGADA